LLNSLAAFSNHYGSKEKTCVSFLSDLLKEVMVQGVNDKRALEILSPKQADSTLIFDYLNAEFSQSKY